MSQNPPEVNFKEITLNPAQSDFVEDRLSKAVAFVTGYGGGKSFSLVLKMILLKLEYPKTDILYVMPTFSMYRDILIPLLREITEGTNIGWEWNKSTGEIFFDCGGRIILKSADDPSKIVGFNVGFVLLDELDTLPTEKAREVFLKSSARARVRLPDGRQNQVFIGTTPEGRRFVYIMFKKNKPDNYRLIQASSRLNPYLDESYFENIIATAPNAQIAKAYIEGHFVNMAVGAVYTAFDAEKCHTDARYRDGEELHLGMDFNVLNMNACVFTKRETLKNSASPYNGKPLLHAIAHLHNITDTPEMIEVIREKYPRSPIHIYPDASGKNASSKGASTSDLSQLRQAGFHVHAKSKNPRVQDRVNSVNSAFKTGLVKVNSNACEELVDSLESQTYNEKTEMPEKTVGSSIDDVNDSFGYIVYYIYPLKRNTVTVAGISPY